jgi:hypothetical protein
MMTFLFLALFAYACLAAVRRPGLCFALCIQMFAIEIVMQSQVGFLLSSSFGNQLVNYAIGLTTIAALLKVNFSQEQDYGWIKYRTAICVWLLCLWSIITLLWSLDGEAGWAGVRATWPYMVLGTVLIPGTVRDLHSLSSAFQFTRVVGLILCAVILVSPEFTTRDGRVGIDLAVSTSARSNPLVIGELGGIQVLLGVLLVTRKKSWLEFLIRAASVVVGTAIAFKSGSRGQIIFAISFAVIFYPASFRIINFRAFLSAVILFSGIGLATSVIFNTVYSNWELKRFSLESIFYSSSSAGSRLGAVSALALEWGNRPSAWLFGLGLNSYPALPLGTGDIYSHVVFADAIFELGLIGFALLLVILHATVTNCVNILRKAINSNAFDRSTAGTLVALVAYETMLVNKQGTIWGSFVFWLFVIITHIISNRMDDLPSHDHYPASDGTTLSAS